MHHIWRLHHFLSVAEHGSFHAAARAVNVSQPALTKSIRILESELGSPLFLRFPGGVRLTDAGILFRNRAREIEASWNASLVELRAQARGLGGQMRIGGGPVYSAVYFPTVLANLRAQFPNLQVSVLTGVGEDLLPALGNGFLRAYAGGLPDKEMPLGREFVTEHLYEQSNSIFASRRHPLFERQDIEPRDLLDYPWLSLFGGQRANAKIDRFFLEHDLPAPRLALESHSLNIALKMISDHNFIACMPVPLAQSYMASEIRDLGITGFEWSIPTGITYHRSSTAFPPIVSIVNSLRLIVKSFSERKPQGSHHHGKS